MDLEPGPRNDSNFRVMLVFTYTQREFIHYYYKWLDTFSKIGGTKSIIAQIFTLMLPWFIIRYFNKIGRIIIIKQNEKLVKKYRKLFVEA